METIEKELLEAYLRVDSLRRDADRDDLKNHLFREWAKIDLHLIEMRIHNVITELGIVDRQAEGYEAIEIAKRR